MKEPEFKHDRSNIIQLKKQKAVVCTSGKFWIHLIFITLPVLGWGTKPLCTSVRTTLVDFPQK